MSDLVGKTILHYKILGLVGQGGMGVVYKVEDTNLQRLVAIKFLPPDLTRDQEANERFINEARAASALDHPNVGTIHEVDRTEDGQMFIVMAYYEGETLKDRIARGPLAVEEATGIAEQIAQGLARAHESNIIHRDIKPANIIITDRGEVKIVDFGLAKLAGRTQLTKAGTTMGTVAYMSPEQAQGKAVDHRTDIWSLGLVLYEMLTGQLPFKGEYDQVVMYAIVNEQPEPITGLCAGVPLELERDVFKCLEKTPEERYQSATELLMDLRTISKSLSNNQTGSVAVAAIPKAAQAARRRKRPSVVTAVGLGGLVVIVAILAYFNLQPKDTLPRLSNPRQVTSAQGRENYPTWSPSGERLAYHALESGNWDIWVSQVGGGPPVNLTADHQRADLWPSWSPDGLQIAFWSARDGGGTFVIDALGGVPRKILPSSLHSYPHWSQDGTKLACIVRDTIGYFVEIVTFLTGSSRRLHLPGSGNSKTKWGLRWSQDERAFAYQDGLGDLSAQSQLWVLRLADGKSVPVTDGSSHARCAGWSPDGRFLYYVTKGDLWQQRLRSDYTPDGPAQPVTVGIGMESAMFSRDEGKIAYAKTQQISNIWSVPVPGPHAPPATWAEAQQITFDAANVSYADVSADGRRLLFSSDRGGNHDIWMLTLADGRLLQLTTHPALDMKPVWSPDGQEIVFHSKRSGNRDIWVMSADGSVARQLTQHEALDMRPDWSPDGQEIAFQSYRSGNSDIWVIPAAGGEARQVTSHPASEAYPQWSPDGKWLVFSSTRGSELLGLWRVPAKGGQPERISKEYGKYDVSPLWPRHGKRIYFMRNMKGVLTLRELSMEDGSERQVLDLQGRPGAFWGSEVKATDGKRLYFGWAESIGDIWVMDVEWEE